LLFPLKNLPWHVNSREVSTGEKLMKSDKISYNRRSDRSCNLVVVMEN
jgi:hypothetical protein